MSGVIIYGNPISNYVRAARMACEEKGISHQLEGFASLKALKEPEHLARHPFGKVPTLEHGGVQLFETAAMCRYIDEAFEGPPLQPSDAAGRARMEQWISATNAYFDPDVVRRFVLQYFFPSGPDGQPDRTRIDKAIPAIRRDFGILDQALANDDYLAGDQMTLADLILIPVFGFALGTPEGPDLVSEHPNLQDWVDRMSARDSFKATAPPSAGS